MAQSALEQECIRRISEWKSALSTHDRGVTFGLLLSLVPLFPVALFGLLTCSLNYALWKQGKLDLHELPWIKRGLVIGLLNSVVGIAVLAVLIHLLFGFDWQQHFSALSERWMQLLNWLQGLFHANKEDVSV